MPEIPDRPEDQKRDDWAQSLANRIAVARTAAGLTQQELADKVGVSRPQITNLECGRGDPSLSTLRGIAAGTGVTVGALLGEGDDPELLHFVTKLLGQQRTMAGHLVALADAVHGIAKAYEATELDVKKIKEAAYRAGREEMDAELRRTRQIAETFEQRYREMAERVERLESIWLRAARSDIPEGRDETL